ncbi:MAG: catechol 1,2-dioxygenase [Actinomycetota bacterium]
MSTVVAGVMASHTTLMNTRWEEVDHLDRAHAFRDGLHAARDLLAEKEIDAAVVIGPNHFRGFWLDLMPSITVGVDEVLGAGEHRTPEGPLPTDPVLARHVLETLLDNDVDAALSLRISVDHGITHPVQYVIPDGTPIIPVVVNSFAPPLPRLDRVARYGELIGAAITNDGRDLRVAVIGSGGLSHRLPFPDWRSPESEDDEFLIQSWLDGRDNWTGFEERRRKIVVAAPPDLNPAFDREVLDLLAAGDGAALCRWETDLVATAGNGANELRNWIATAAACGWAPSRTIVYSEMPEWLTGMAVAAIEQPLTVGTSEVHT